jgi:hypothetical protein
MIAASSGGLFFSSGTVPFTAALGLMLAIGLLELLSTVMGFGVSHALDKVVGALHLDTDVDADVQVGDAHHVGALSQVLGWLHVGKVPVLIVFVIFLTLFGLLGLALQALIQGLTGSMLPAVLAVIPAFVGSLPGVRLTAGVLARVLPRDETDAVSRSSFIGRIATLGPATATRGEPAQAKLRDQHGQAHYVLVEPDNDGDVLDAGSDVLLVRQGSAVYYAIRNTSVALGTRAQG